MPNIGKVLGAASQGLRWLIFGRLGMRTITFTMNLWINRQMDAAAFGVAALHLELLFMGTVVLVRDGQRL